MPKEEAREKTGPNAIGENHVGAKESIAQSAIPTISEIEELKQRADLEKEAASGGPSISPRQARQAVIVPAMRYVWAVSLLLAILAMIIVFFVTVG